MRRLGWEVEAGAAAVRRAFAAPGRERDAGVQALKAAGAAVAAWALVGWWWQAPMALMAPWTAVALVQGTVYRSVRTGVQQLALITAGTLLAAGAALATGSVMAAMALALPPAALLGAHNRFGDQGVYAPTTVIFVLAYGTFSGYDIAHRLGEAVVGAAIGIGVNALLLPPVHLRGVREALATMAGESTGLLRQMADDVESGCDEADARRWKDRAGSLTATLEGLRSARTWSRESYRFNPGHRMRRGARRPPPIEHDLYWERFMERLAALVDNLAAGAGRDRDLALPPPARLGVLARLLRAVADVCDWDRRRWDLPPGAADRAEREAAVARAEDALADLKAGLVSYDQETAVALGAVAASGQQLLGLVRGVA
ncbi:hypothetical protein AB0957_19675 [Streptomyces zhihengii]|uniref:hypothetical protein n=1 Tax=Streptomyces zhihengii TaxID=1818004 RepID=UPI003455A918